MSPKTKTAAKPAPKASKPAKAEKVDKKAAGKPAKAAAAPAGKGPKDKKGGKAAAAAEAATPVEGEGPQVDLDELEEAQDEAAAKGSGGNSSAAALAAATGQGEMSASFKNFRHHPDMENFYRFIYENDLRHEALAIIETVLVEKRAKKAAGPVHKGKH